MNRVTTKPKIFVIALLALIVLSISAAYAAAQYTTQKTTNVTIGSNGTFTATEPDVGVSYQILGVPGSTGTVTAGTYSGNPQATAAVPSGISLTDFIAITFNIPSSDFTEAEVTLNYTASEVQNIQSPYAVYKYISSSNSYVELPSTVDTTAKTITVTLTSITDPVLAIGGATITTSTPKPGSPGLSASTWIVIAVSAIIIVVLVVFVVSRMRRQDEGVIVVPPSGDVKPRPQAPTNVENKPQTETPNNQERNNESNHSYSLIVDSAKSPTKPEKLEDSAENKPQSPNSTTQEDKTARIKAEKKQQPAKPKKQKKQDEQNDT